MTGLLVENTYEAWLDAMEQYASDRALRQRVRDAAFAHLMQDYHVSAGARVLSCLIAELVTGPCAGRAAAMGN